MVAFYNGYKNRTDNSTVTACKYGNYTIKMCVGGIELGYEKCGCLALFTSKLIALLRTYCKTRFTRKNYLSRFGGG